MKPFLALIISLLDSETKSYKWNVFEFLTKEFLQNENLIVYESLYQSFYKKMLKFLASNLKEKKHDKIETIFDWIRNLSIRKQNCLNSLQDEYINILNMTDFKDLNESSIKKLIELVHWLPKVNRYLFTKLSFLVLGNNLSLFNVNQLLSILKVKNENGSCDQSDYIMFILNLFNGYSSFELLHSTRDNQTGDFYMFENGAKFTRHVELCSELENFICSHKNSDCLIDLLLSSSLPILNKIEKGIYTTTLYGSLSLISQIESLDKLGASYENIVIVWLGNSFYWIASRYFELKGEAYDQTNENFACVEKLLRKFTQILTSDRILNDCVAQIANMLNLCKS